MRLRIMEAFPAYTWSALNDEDPAFLRALMIRAMGTNREQDEEEVEPDGVGDFDPDLS
jgi:hypothetical protein